MTRRAGRHPGLPRRGSPRLLRPVRGLLGRPARRGPQAGGAVALRGRAGRRGDRRRRRHGRAEGRPRPHARRLPAAGRAGRPRRLGHSPGDGERPPDRLDRRAGRAGPDPGLGLHGLAAARQGGAARRQAGDDALAGRWGRCGRWFPAVTVVDEEHVVEDGDVLTSAGISAGIDMALRVVARHHGEAVARATARHMEYPFPEDNRRRV